MNYEIIKWQKGIHYDGMAVFSERIKSEILKVLIGDECYLNDQKIG